MSKKSTGTVITDKTNPYRVGSNYHQLARQGGKAFISTPRLRAKVAMLTKRTVKLVGYDLSVVGNQKHQSNRGTKAIENAKGEIKLVLS